MQPNQIAAFQAIEQAQQARKAGDNLTARHYAEQAAHTAPELEEVWLMMAACAEPQASVEHLQKALQINPQSQRAQKGLLWAMERLRKEQAEKAAQAQPVVATLSVEPESAQQPQEIPTVEKTQPTHPVPLPVETQPVKVAAMPASTPVAPPPIQSKPQVSQPQRALTRKSVSYVAILAIILCLVAGIFIAKNVTPVAALFAPEAHGPAWAQADISKSTDAPALLATEIPTLTPLPTATVAPAATLTTLPTLADLPTSTSLPAFTTTLAVTNTPLPTGTLVPTVTPTTSLTEEASPTPLPTDTAAPTSAIPTPKSPQQSYNPGGTGGERWIDVNLSQQMVYAYEGNTLINSFLVSTGTWQYPTVTGSYHVYVKYRATLMTGPGYYLPNVPYTMYFYKGYALHGTYWHSNFGTPMSHGCVNLSIPDSAWLYNWASVGTLVNVHY